MAMWRAATRLERGPENEKINPYFSDQRKASHTIPAQRLTHISTRIISRAQKSLKSTKRIDEKKTMFSEEELLSRIEELELTIDEIRDEHELQLEKITKQLKEEENIR